MAKNRTVYVCAECGGTTEVAGQMPALQCLEHAGETVESSAPSAAAHRYAPLASSSPVRSLSEIEARETPRQPTGLDDSTVCWAAAWWPAPWC